MSQDATPSRVGIAHFCVDGNPLCAPKGARPVARVVDNLGDGTVGRNVEGIVETDTRYVDVPGSICGNVHGLREVPRSVAGWLRQEKLVSHGSERSAQNRRDRGSSTLNWRRACRYG